MLAGCIILSNNAILLLYRKKTGWYELPGGKIEEGESVEEAALRELKEELCVDVDIIHNLGTKDFEENGFIMTYIWFLAKLKSGQIPSIGEPDKYDHFRYIPINELQKNALSPNMQNVARELQNGKIQL